MLRKLRYIFTGALIIGCFTVTTTLGQQKNNLFDKDQLKKVQVNNTTVNYMEYGKGAPVVLVHGTLDDYRSWAGQVEPFAKNYRVVSYSRRYHYPNPWPQDSLGFSVSVHAKDLVSFIQALELKKVHLVGHSFGGYVALLAARDNPEMVRSLTLAEPPVIPLIAGSSPGDSLLQSFMQNSILPSRAAFKRGNKEEGIRRFVNGVLGDNTYQKLPPPVHANMMDNVRELKGEMMVMGKNLFPAFACKDASRLQVPVLLLDGEWSPEIMGLINDNLKKCLLNTERATIPTASHQMQAQNAKAFNKLVLSFLAKH